MLIKTGNEYYNGASVLNADCPISLIWGSRSSGKSFYWKRHCIKKFLNENRQFIYIRRTDEDIKTAAFTFFDDIKVKFPNYGMEHISGRFYIGKLDPDNDLINPQLCGYSFSLNRLHKLKSVVLDQVDFIFFDEFLPEDNRYLHPNDPEFEPTQLMSMYMTVARGINRPIREEVKLVCVSNLSTSYSPYHSYFGISMGNKTRGIFNGVYAENVVNLNTSNAIRDSKFGAILQSTSYGDFALNNTALADDDRNIIPKVPRQANPWFNLRVRNKWYMCLFDLDGIYFTERYDKTLKEKYGFSAIDIDPEEIPNLPLFAGEIQKACCQYAKQDRVYFTSGFAKSAIYGLILPPQSKR